MAWVTPKAELACQLESPGLKHSEGLKIQKDPVLHFTLTRVHFALTHRCFLLVQNNATAANLNPTADWKSNALVLPPGDGGKGGIEDVQEKLRALLVNPAVCEKFRFQQIDAEAILMLTQGDCYIHLQKMGLALGPCVKLQAFANTINLALVTPSLAAPSMVSHQPTVCHPLVTVVEQVVHGDFSHTSSASDDSGIDKPEKISPIPKSPSQSQINDKNLKSIDSYTLSSDGKEGGPLDLDTFERNLGGRTSISEHSTSLERTLTSEITATSLSQSFLLLLQWRSAAQ